MAEGSKFPDGIDHNTAIVIVAHEIAARAMSAYDVEENGPEKTADEYTKLFKSVYSRIRFNGNSTEFIDPAS